MAKVLRLVQHGTLPITKFEKCQPLIEINPIVQPHWRSKTWFMIYEYATLSMHDLSGLPLLDHIASQEPRTLLITARASKNSALALVFDVHVLSAFRLKLCDVIAVSTVGLLKLVERKYLMNDFNEMFGSCR